MRNTPSFFSADKMNREDSWKRCTYYKNFYTPTYIGKLCIKEPEKLPVRYCSPYDIPNIRYNMYENCGSFCYVFGFSHWNTFECRRNTFHDNPREGLRNIKVSNEYILVGEHGIFIQTTGCSRNNIFYWGDCNVDSVFRFVDHNHEEKCWNFELIHDSAVIYDFDNIDFLAPCPEDVWKKFSFISHYKNKQFLGPEIPISQKTRDRMGYFAKNSIVSARKMENFHLSLFDDHRNMKIFEIDATSFIFDSEPNTNEYSAIYFKDFPGLSYLGKMGRNDELWLFDPDLSEFDEFYTTAFAGKLQKVKGCIVNIKDRVLSICITSINIQKIVEIPLHETELNEEILQAFHDYKIIQLELLLFFNYNHEHYKILKCEFE